MISETSVRAGARKLFEQHLYPIMAPHQQALFVPPAYGCNDTACANIAFHFGNVASVQFAFDIFGYDHTT